MDGVDGDSAGLDGFAVFRPRQRGVVGGIGGFCDGEHQFPADGTARHHVDQEVEQSVPVAFRVLLGRLVMQHRYRRPTDRLRLALGIGGPKSVEAAVGTVGEPRARRSLFDELHRRGGFGVIGQERRHRLRVRLSGPRYGTRGQHPVVETARRAVGEHRKVHHRDTPLLAVGQVEHQAESPDRVRFVGLVGQPAGQREPSDDGHRAGLEYLGLAHLGAGTCAGERSRRRKPLGVVAAETFVTAGDLLEAVGEICRCQRVGPQPARCLGEPARADGQHTADRGQPQQRSPAVELRNVIRFHPVRTSHRRRTPSSVKRNAGVDGSIDRP